MTIERPSRYDAVHVLLLSWEEGDAKMHEQLLELQHTFEKFYNYDVEEWKIPRDRPYTELNYYLMDYRKRHDGFQTLLIIYYAGHSSMSPDRDPIFMLYVCYFMQ